MKFNASKTRGATVELEVVASRSMKAASVDAYLASLPADRRAEVSAVRDVIRKNLPAGYEEGIQYGMIGYCVPHHRYPAGYHTDPKQPLPFASLASQKSHMALYLMCVYGSKKVHDAFVADYAKSGKKLDMGKSCVRFKRAADLALDVIGRTIASVSVDEYIAAYEAGLPASARAKLAKRSPPAPAAARAKKAARGAAKAYVALLRGVNVGGNNLLPMRDLAKLFTAAGCDRVSTYIQSGNVVFSATADVAARVPAAVGDAVERRFGFRVPIVIRTTDELRDVIRVNPFLDRGADPSALYVAFLADAPSARSIATLDPKRSPPDAFEVRGREIYLHYAKGAGKTKLTNAYFDSKLDTISTARNWRTTQKLLELLTALES